MKIKILIADDDTLIREGLRIILQLDDDFEVASCVENGKQAVEFCRTNKVDIALLDVRMPVMNGLEASKAIAEGGYARPLILTTFDDAELIVGAVKSGARGYLLKNTPPERLKDSIKVVYNGGTVMQDLAFEKIKFELESNTMQKKDPAARKIKNELFTERELQIMELIAKGLSNREIAQTIYISEGTVKNYISSILDKTGLQHRTQIAIYYLNGGT